MKVALMLQRELPDDRMLFLLATVVLDRSEDVVSSTVEGLEGAIAGGGSDEDAALNSAVDLLTGRVDYALEHDQEISRVLGRKVKAMIFLQPQYRREEWQALPQAAELVAAHV